MINHFFYYSENSVRRRWLSSTKIESKMYLKVFLVQVLMFANTERDIGNRAGFICKQAELLIKKAVHKYISKNKIITCICYIKFHILMQHFGILHCPVFCWSSWFSLSQEARNRTHMQSLFLEDIKCESN